MEGRPGASPIGQGQGVAAMNLRGWFGGVGPTSSPRSPRWYTPPVSADSSKPAGQPAVPRSRSGFRGVDAGPPGLRLRL